MARPPKNGLEYFPHDTDTERDLEYIEAKHGLLGYAVFFKLLERIYDELGYYMVWSERRCILLSRKWQIEPSTLQAVLDDLLEEGLFSKDHYEEYGVLTSAAAQRRYLAACERRLRIDIREDLLLCEIQLSKTARVAVHVIDQGGSTRSVHQNEGYGNQNEDSGNQNPSNGQPECPKAKQSKEKEKAAAAAGAEFHAWLKTWAASNPKLRNAPAFVRKVLADPAGYPDLLELYQEHLGRASPSPPTPPPPETCDTCGSTEFRETTGVRECRVCGRHFELADGEWRADPDTGRPPPSAFEDDPQTDFEDDEHDEPGVATG